jgi:hypothetical protein
VDLASFILMPAQALGDADVKLLAAKRWPTVLTREQLLRVTAEKAPPTALAAQMSGDRLDYYCNTRVDYTLRGLHVRLDARWDYEAPPGGGDTHLAVVRGSRARIEIRQGAEQKWRTELYAVPAEGGGKAALRAAVEKKLASLASRFPGLAAEDVGDAVHIVIPDAFRTSHEAHFAEVTSRFLEYLRAPSSVPAWEKANMLSKYAVTTRGTALSRKQGRLAE